jgi:hypothetical protein
MMGTQSPETCREKKHAKKNCAPSWLYLQDYTEMHGQQNLKFVNYGLFHPVSRMHVTPLCVLRSLLRPLIIFPLSVAQGCLSVPRPGSLPVYMNVPYKTCNSVNSLPPVQSECRPRSNSRLSAQSEQSVDAFAVKQSRH